MTLMIFRGRPVLGAVALAGVTVLVWWGWLGGDTTKELDPVTGNETGPYSAMQVAGCVLTLSAVLVVAVLAGVPRRPAAAVMTVSFTVAWTVQAAAADDSGLYLVGAILVAAGMTVGTAAVVLLTGLVRDRWPASSTVPSRLGRP
ncbi:hypothetical protein [Jidongwangia harbinensis]|uniref:hypothetical protein n=1 Tax=Jidongwangia harbinensis TaxID=2878561 RepID=UPI001CD992FE|nr:hypothetical protein [Jidongwangia harbinensis]MCA2214856.1 hypothetical protein [Jidongwangia harbinensis]